MRVTDSAGALGASLSRDRTSASRVVPVVAQLASDLRTKLGEAPPSDPAVAERTSLSASLEADHELFLAFGFAEAGKSADSIAHARRALALDPAFARAYAFLALQLRNQFRNDEALRTFQLALKWSDSLSENERLRLVGDYEWAFGDVDRAIDAYEKRLAACPRDWTTMGNLSGAYAAKGDVAKALALENRIIAQHPRDITIRGNVVLDELLMGDVVQAANDARTILDEFPHPPSLTYLYLAVAEALLDRPDSAKDAYAKLAVVDASLAAFGVADLEAAAGHLSEAALLLERGIAADDANGEKAHAAVKWAALAEARLGQGEKAKALEAAEKALASGDAQTLYMAGEAMLDAHDPPRLPEVGEIVSRLGRGVTRDEKYYSDLLGADVLVAKDNARLALHVLDDAQKLGGSWLVHYHRARAYVELREVDRAEAELRACLEHRADGALAFDDAPSIRYLSRVQGPSAMSPTSLPSASSR
jgi:tetratricopeptide (TPR) repeat protein